MLTSALIGRLRVKHLELFRHVAEQRTLRRAAELSHMTQPAATKLIKEVEEIAGTQLFLRERRGMKPTLQGEVMYRHVTLFLADLARMEQELALVAQGGAGHIRLGVLPSLAPGLLTRSITGMLQAHPSVRFTVKEADTNGLLAALERNELDLAFARVQEQQLLERLEVAHVYSEPFVVVVRKGHPLMRRPQRSRLAALSKADWVLPERSTPMRRMLEQLFIRQGTLIPDPAVECTALEKVLDLIVGSDMVGVLPRSFSLNGARHREITALHADIPFAPTSLVMRRHSGVAPVIEAFLRRVQGTAAQLGLC